MRVRARESATVVPRSSAWSRLVRTSWHGEADPRHSLIRARNCTCPRRVGFEDGRLKVFQNVSALASARDRHWEAITMRGHVAKKGNRYYAVIYEGSEIGRAHV